MKKKYLILLGEATFRISDEECFYLSKYLGEGDTREEAEQKVQKLLEEGYSSLEIREVFLTK